MITLQAEFWRTIKKPDCARNFRELCAGCRPEQTMHGVVMGRAIWLIARVILNGEIAVEIRVGD